MLLAAQASQNQLSGPLGLQLPALDWIGLVVVLAFGLLGALRGLWWQFFRCVALVLALALAAALSPLLTGQLLKWVPSLNAGVAGALCFLSLFVATLKLASLLGRLGASALKAMQLRPLDRLAGALLGLLTGLALHGAAVVGLRHWGPPVWAAQTIQGTRSERLSEDFVRTAEQLWAHWPELKQRLRNALDRLQPAQETGPEPVSGQAHSAQPAGAGGHSGAVR